MQVIENTIGRSYNYLTLTGRMEYASSSKKELKNEVKKEENTL